MTIEESAMETTAVAAPSGGQDAKSLSSDIESEAERNAVFETLVTGDGDIVGLVAYSLYKQNTHDWLIAFARIKGREPDEVELTSYIIGESTPRRLATYRHLAEATLEGRGPEVPVGAGQPGEAAQRSFAIAARPRVTTAARGGGAAGTVAAFVVLVAVAAVAVYLAGRYGLPGMTR